MSISDHGLKLYCNTLSKMLFVDPIYFKTGFNTKKSVTMAHPDQDGVISLKMGQNQRLEISLVDEDDTPRHISVYHVVNNKLRRPPTGLSINHKTGTINWMPGPVYLGRYQLAVFVKDKNGIINKKTITVEIGPEKKVVIR